MSQMLHDILKLSVSERILMVEAIWDSIAEGERLIELSSEAKQMLDERLELHRNNPSEGSSWNYVENRIKNQL
jgi:putative addiction module component (TIGR02574 family)